MPGLSGILANELEIVGFRGAPLVECSRAMPVVRRKSDRMHCVLNSVQDLAALSWHDEEEATEFARAGRWTRMREPLPVPRSCISALDQPFSRQPMVVFAARSFLEAEGSIAWPPRFREEVFVWRPLESNGDSIQAACGSAEVVEALLDHWAGALKERFDAMRRRGHDQASLKRVADFMLCAARNRPLRWQAYLRYAMVQDPEKVQRTFDAFTHREFPDVNWETYLDEIKNLGEVLRSVAVAEPGPILTPSRAVTMSKLCGIGNRQPEDVIKRKVA
jgi:hypothetical protein